MNTATLIIIGANIAGQWVVEVKNVALEVCEQKVEYILGERDYADVLAYTRKIIEEGGEVTLNMLAAQQPVLNRRSVGQKISAMCVPQVNA